MITLTSYKSNTPEMLLAAFYAGRQFVFIDSGTAGEDDLIYLLPGETIEDVRNQVEPNPWSLREIPKEEMAEIVASFIDENA